MSDFFDRLDKYMTHSKLNDNKLTVLAGLSVGALGKQRKGSRGLSNDSIAKILYMCPDLNADWLLTGRGEMLTTNEQAQEVIVKDRFDLYTDRNQEIQRIPLYELEASAGLVSLFVDSHNFIPIDYITIPDLPHCDGALYVRGDSMYPILKSGDIVMYKVVNDMKYGILWGEMYLVSYIIDGEEYIVVKYIQKSSDQACIKLVSHNQNHSPQDIPLSYIQAVALIKATVRFNTLK